MSKAAYLDAAGKSTLNRLELSDGTPNRYKKITFWKDGIDELLVQVFLESYAAEMGARAA